MWKRIPDDKKLLISLLFFSTAASGNQWVISQPVNVYDHKHATFKVSPPVLITRKKDAIETNIHSNKIKQYTSFNSVKSMASIESTTAKNAKAVEKVIEKPVISSFANHEISNAVRHSGINAGSYYFEEDEMEAMEELKHWKGWFKPYYDSGNRNEVGGVKGFSNKTTGFSIGADAEMSNKARVGTAFTFDKTSINGDDKRDTKQRTLLGSFYTQWDNRMLFLNTTLSMGQSTADTTRMSGELKYEGDFKANIWSANATAGRHFRYRGWNIDALTLLNYNSVSFDDYLEKASTGQSEKMMPSNFEAMEFGLGFKLNRTYWGRTLVRRGKYKPEFSLTGFYDINSNGSSVKSRFATGPDSFVVTSPKRDKFRLKGELGLTVSTYRRWTFKAGYLFHWSSNYNSHGISAQADYRF